MNVDNAQHLLPESIRDMVDVIGLPATMQVVELLGGLSIKFPQRGVSLHPEVEMLRPQLGDKVLAQLADCFVGGTIYIPRCEAALRHIRNQRFVDEVAALTEDGLSTTAAIMRLCPKYKISDRTAWKILSKDVSQHQQLPLL